MEKPRKLGTAQAAPATWRDSLQVRLEDDPANHPEIPDCSIEVGRRVHWAATGIMDAAETRIEELPSSTPRDESHEENRTLRRGERREEPMPHDGRGNMLETML